MGNRTTKRINLKISKKTREEIDSLIQSLDAGSMSEAIRRGIHRAKKITDYLDGGYEISATKDSEIVKIDFI